MRHTYPFLSRLNLDENANVIAIRRAYARELQVMARAHDAVKFDDLTQAYNTALTWSTQQSPAGALVERSREPLFDQAAPFPAARPSAAQARKSSLCKPKGRSGSAPATQANAALLKLNEACAVLGRGRLLCDQSLWQSAIQLRLDDAQLSDEHARLAFEMLVARQLAAGWKPGHEALFCAAAAVFNWENDPARLAQFGEAGDMIGRAIDQRKRFEAQPQQILQAQRKIAMRLRRMPAAADVISKKDVLRLEYMMARFATLLALTVDTEAILEWRQRYHSTAAARPSPNQAGDKHHGEPQLNKNIGGIDAKTGMAIGAVALFGLGMFSVWKSAAH
jgi:hypothetical protein